MIEILKNIWDGASFLFLATLVISIIPFLIWVAMVITWAWIVYLVIGFLVLAYILGASFRKDMDEIEELWRY